jgi:hypothetical protein
MHLYCLEDFKEAVGKLAKSKSYATVERAIIEHFCGKTVDEVRNGVNLNNSDTVPYIKKRLEGSGGFRVYFLLLIKNDCLYLMYVHPKTGAEGSENITDDAKKDFYKKVLACIKADDGLYHVRPNTKGDKLVFSVKKAGELEPAVI